MTSTEGLGGYTGEDEGQQGTGQNPAWNEFLEVVPQEFHDKVTPLLSKWDQGVNERFNKVHSEYEPWKPIIQASGDPDTAQFALNLLDAMQNNPEVIYNALKDRYKFDESAPPQQQSYNQPGYNQQGSNTGQGQNEPNIQDDPYASRFAALEQQNRTMSEILIANRQSELAKQEDFALDQELNSAKQKYGDYDERYVLAMMQNGMPVDSAVRQFQEFRDNVAKQYVPRPFIMGGGGGAPGANFNPAKMSDKQVNELVAQQLSAAAAERRR